MAETIYISDTNNNRIVELLASDLSYVADSSSTNFIQAPRGLCTDGTFLYVCRRVETVSTLHKYVLGATVADLVEDSSVVLSGNNLQGICTDGTNLYIVDVSGLRVMKRLCSDLSFVTAVSAFDSGDQFWNPKGIATDNTYVYVTDWRTGYGCWVKKFLCSDLSWSSTTKPTAFDGRLAGIDIHGNHLFLAEYDRFV